MTWNKTKPTLDERGLSQKKVMLKAQKINNDEFYTRYEDVEKELKMYNKSIWKNKTVFCNCDDAVDDNEKNTSAFALYFIHHFQYLELKKLICTHYSGPVDLLTNEARVVDGNEIAGYDRANEETKGIIPRGLPRKSDNLQRKLSGGCRACPAVLYPSFNQGAKGYIFTKDGFNEFKEYPDGYNGSFDHPRSLKILKEETDIVCTNPPFSKSIDYWDIMIKSGKKFIIISNIAIVLTTAYFQYFKNNKVWAGFNEVDWFLTPKMELTRAAGYWFTNISIQNRPKYKQLKIIPLKEIPEKYKKFDDSKTLLVDNCYIPNDYKKPFAVSTRPILNGLLEKGFKIVKDKKFVPYINKEEKFARVLVQKM